MDIKVVLEKQEEGGYTVHVPALPGCISQGDTKEEALKNIKEAVELYLEADDNEAIMYEGEVAEITV
jgi:predicted RNase H-like HicB family nuclease